MLSEKCRTCENKESREQSKRVKAQVPPDENHVCYICNKTGKELLERANAKVENFIKNCFKLGYRKLIIITGKGSRSKVYNDPYKKIMFLTIIKLKLIHIFFIR